MNVFSGKFLLLILVFSHGVAAFCSKYETKDTLTRDGLTLIFINKSRGFDTTVKKRLEETFFTVYPKLMHQYNPLSLKKVVFIIDPAYQGVAETGDGKSVFNPKWFRDHPGDIDVVTHEVMHIVQAYPDDAGPGWITEGIADYVRYKYGVDNAGGGWALPPYRAGQFYTDSYRITARFFLWVEKQFHVSLVQDLDSRMRSMKYTDNTWKELTGKNPDELWALYAQDPRI